MLSLAPKGVDAQAELIPYCLRVNEKAFSGTEDGNAAFKKGDVRFTFGAVPAARLSDPAF